ncbi:MAG TPA: response regulator [Myxococcaceae bacterium]|nr:response regulator [Myxococcaceae bacterium]
MQRTILIVEDDVPLRKAVREMLTLMGYRVVEAGSGCGARNALAAHVPDLVCLDLALPECSGLELCEYVRSSPAHCNVPVLMMSERLRPSDRAMAFECGADDYLPKPFSREELRVRIEALLQGSPPATADRVPACTPAS